MNIDDNKLKVLENVMSQIEKQFGKGAIVKLGGQSSMDVESISTGSLALDIALGVGGVPKGRIIEIYGPESSGKTTIALSIAAEAQKNGRAAAFVDAEHALDPIYAKKLGVDTDELIVSQPDTGEEALEIAEFDIMFNEGISKEGNLVDIAVNDGIIQKSGAWFSYNEIRIGQGRENAKLYLKENHNIALEIENLIRKKNNIPVLTMNPIVNEKEESLRDSFEDKLESYESNA